MIEISIFQLWYLFDKKFDRLKVKKTNDIRPFCRWLKSCEFSWTVGAASGMLVNVPRDVLEWGRDVPPGPLTLAAGAGGMEER